MRIKMTLDEWKEKVQTSSHIRKHEKVRFYGDKIVRAHCGPSVFLGAYFVEYYDKNIEGTGWYHG